MIRKILSRYLILLLVLTERNAQAQAFHNKAAIDSVTKSGFYKIRVTPVLSTFLNADFSDLRIDDHLGNAVPYLLGSKLNALSFSTAQSGGRLAEADVAEADIHQSFQLAGNGRDVLKKFQGLLAGHV